MRLTLALIFGLLSLTVGVGGWILLFKKHYFTTLLCSLASILSIVCASYHYMLALDESGKKIDFFNPANDIVFYIVLFLLIFGILCAVFSMVSALKRKE